MPNDADATTSATTPTGCHVAWMFELAVREGREADLRALMGEMTAATERTESGTVDYEWYVSDDAGAHRTSASGVRSPSLRHRSCRALRGFSASRAWA